jgi:hypothetical protein
VAGRRLPERRTRPARGGDGRDALGRCLARNLQRLRHQHQVGQRRGFHLSHDISAVNLHGNLADPISLANILLRRPVTTSAITSRSRCVREVKRSRSRARQASRRLKRSSSTTSAPASSRAGQWKMASFPRCRGRSPPGSSAERTRAGWSGSSSPEPCTWPSAGARSPRRSQSSGKTKARRRRLGDRSKSGARPKPPGSVTGIAHPAIRHFKTTSRVRSATLPMTGSRRVPFIFHVRRSTRPVA